jgi:hypothetical protein
MGFYADQVQRYFDRFPQEQIGIWFYEETKLRPREFLREVLEFLKVDSSFIPDTSRRYNEPQIAKAVKSIQMIRRLGVLHSLQRITPTPIKTLVRSAIYKPSGSATMAPEDRALMLDFYRSDIHRLEAILKRDLGAWLV